MFCDKLIELMACDDAVEWVGERTAQQAWAECERADWMMWLLAKMCNEQGWPDRKTVVGLTCDCAETALHLVLEGDDRPRIAVETTRKWIDGEASEENVRDAASAARASRAAASDAAYAAGGAAANAAYAAYAAARAARAARAAYNAYAACAASAAYAAYGETRAANAAYAAVCAGNAVGMGHMRKLAGMIRSKITTIPEVE